MADLKRFFKKTVSEDRHKQAASVSVPEGLWIKCPKCGEMVYREDVISNAYVCPKCGGYFRISAKRRIKMIAVKQPFPSPIGELHFSIIHPLFKDLDDQYGADQAAYKTVLNIVDRFRERYPNCEWEDEDVDYIDAIEGFATNLLMATLGKGEANEQRKRYWLYPR